MGIFCCFQSDNGDGGPAPASAAVAPSSSSPSSSRSSGGGGNKKKSTSSIAYNGNAGEGESSHGGGSSRTNNNNLVNLVNEIVAESVTYRHRHVADEILKIGKGKVTARAFTYGELSEATGGFRPESLLGEGGFGPVYRGRLMGKAGNVVEAAVKQLDRNGMQGTREFLVENLVQWAAPRFKDKKLFAEMADPLLRGAYPTKGLYQALAIAAMCLQEDATMRPAISDVVTALEYLTVAGASEDPPTSPAAAAATGGRRPTSMISTPVKLLC
ncbi:hypothetical protein ABZP36_036127 [Zizania latifolia]